MAIAKLAYGTTTAVTCTLGGLAANSARQSAAIDNSGGCYQDYMLDITVRLGSGAPSGEKAIYVYLYHSLSGTSFTDPANAAGTDAAITLRTPSCLTYLGVLPVPTSGAITYRKIFPSIAFASGGNVPYEWGFVIENKSGIAFGSTEGNHSKVVRGIYGTII